ncbi:MAG: hypothetical protein C5B53_02680, partial [Candidatus Melainabacteria bacterium]
MESHIHREQRASTIKMAAAYVLCCLIGGTAVFSIRQQIGENGYPIYLAASVRFSGAALGYLLLAYLTSNLKVSRSDAAYLIIGGLCSGAAHVFVYRATKHLPGSIMTVLFATCPIIAAFLAWLTRTERINKGTLAGAAIAALGIIIVFFDRLQVPEELWALRNACIGMVLLSFCNLAVRRLKAAPVLAQGAIFFLAATPVLWIAYWVYGERRPPGPLPLYESACLVYTTCFISGVAFALYLWMMKNLGMMRTMSCVFFQIIVALVVDAVWESEALGWVSYVGSAVVVAGVLLEWRLKNRPSRQTQTIKILGAPSANGAVHQDA